MDAVDSENKTATGSLTIYDPDTGSGVDASNHNTSLPPKVANKRPSRDPNTRRATRNILKLCVLGYVMDN